MRRPAFWLSILVPALAVVCGVCWGPFTLGVPGEWVWDRVAPTEPLWLALGPVLVAAALYLGFVWIGAQLVEGSRPWSMSAWIFGLVVSGFVWLWFAQEGAPDNYQMSKAVWALYFRGSSGYFSEANENAGDLAAYLAGYERKMAEGDVLHIGTHPPGLTVALRALLGLCREFPALIDVSQATESDSVRAAFDAFDATSLLPRPLSGVERAVLWLAAILVHLGAALSVVPLFGLLRTTCSRRASWLAVAFWPTMPALAIFLPKADCLYPLLATAFLWLWMTALARRSHLFSVLAGLVLWVSLTLSLAFLPIALIALLASYWMISREGLPPQLATGPSNQASLTSERAARGESSEKIRKLVPAAGWALLGFAVPCLATAWFLKLNLLTVWSLNLRNHAGFYNQFPRTYWKWLLVNPIELAVAAGVPLTVLAIWSIVGQWRNSNARRPGHVWAWLLTLGILWLSGKNMGEAARLWILFMPFLVWSAGPLFEPKSFESPATSQSRIPLSRQAQPSATFSAGEMFVPGAGNGWCVALAVQLVTTAAIVTHVVGFHFR